MRIFFYSVEIADQIDREFITDIIPYITISWIVRHWLCPAFILFQGSFPKYNKKYLICYFKQSTI